MLGGRSGKKRNVRIVYVFVPFLGCVPHLFRFLSVFVPISWLPVSFFLPCTVVVRILPCRRTEGSCGVVPGACQVHPSLNLEPRQQMNESDRWTKRLDWMQKSLAALISQHDNDDEETKALVVKVKKDKKERRAALMSLRGLDHALQFVGSGLQDFLPHEGSAPLAAGEVRYKVPHEDPEGIVKFKYCIKSEDGQNKKYEVPLYALGD